MTTRKDQGKRGGAQQTLTLPKRDGVSEAALLAEAALRPAIASGAVIEAYQDHIFGDGVEVGELVNALQASMGKSNFGDLSELENMLIGQAMALQTMFVSLARRAQAQQTQRNLEAFLGLALKAQGQSRATIQALIDLKFPRQATFVRQANIANNQQVINGVERSAHALEDRTEQIEVLEGVTHGSTTLDARAAAAPAGGHPTLETVAAVHRSAKRSRQG